MWSRALFGLIVIAAPSGTGKSTLCQALVSKLKANLALSISTTSRAPRGSEVNSVEYFFVSAEEFALNIKNKIYVEWAQVHGNYYGTSIKTLENFWSQKKHVLLDIDVQGAMNLKKQFADRVFTIFIVPPSSEELEKRLRGRATESEDKIQIRLKNAVVEMNTQNEFDQVIVNDKLEQALQQLEQVIKTKMDFWEAKKNA